MKDTYTNPYQVSVQVYVSDDSYPCVFDPSDEAEVEHHEDRGTEMEDLSVRLSDRLVNKILSEGGKCELTTVYFQSEVDSDDPAVHYYAEPGLRQLDASLNKELGYGILGGGGIFTCYTFSEPLLTLDDVIRVEEEAEEGAQRDRVHDIIGNYMMS